MQKVPEGCKLSLTNQQLLTSTGVEALDALIGGGLSVGTVLLLHEDDTNSMSQVFGRGVYSGALMRYVASQALVGHKTHSLCQISTCQSADEFAQSLMPLHVRKSSSSVKTSTEPPPTAAVDKMKIAWRYENQGAAHTQTTPSVQPTGFKRAVGTQKLGIGQRNAQQQVTVAEQQQELTYTHEFDMRATKLLSQIDGTRVTLLQAGAYETIWQQLQQSINDRHCSPSHQAPLHQRKIMRVILPSLDIGCGDLKQLIRFLMALRGLLRHSFATCVVSVSSAALGLSQQDMLLLDRYVDASIELQAYPLGDKTSYYTREYHGTLSVRKQYTINSQLPAPSSQLPSPATCKSQALDTSNRVADTLLFKCRRNKFCIEQMHLPPDADIGAVDTLNKKGATFTKSSSSDDW